MTRTDADETAHRLARVYRAPFIVLAGLNPGTYDVERYFGPGYGLDVVWPPSEPEPCSDVATQFRHPGRCDVASQAGTLVGLDKPLKTRTEFIEIRAAGRIPLSSK